MSWRESTRVRRAPRKPGSSRLSIATLAPTLVVVVGIAVATGIALLGMTQLRAQSDEAAGLRSEVLARSLAARLSATALEDRSAVVERAARRSGAEMLLVEQDGRIMVDGSLSPLPRAALVGALVAGDGEISTALGRTRFFVAPLRHPLGHLSVVAFVRAPERPFATSSLQTSVAALALLLTGIAALVAYAFARDVRADVLYVRERIVEMATHETNPSGQLVPVRDVDQVGLLTSAFNVLVERFTAAERAYRQDLAGAFESDRERSAFLAALSHELRTPLNAILGFTDVLLSEVDGPLSEDAHENLVVLRRSAEHLRSLIADILDLSALESGEMTLEQGEVDVFEVAAEVAREARVTARDRPLAIDLTGTPAVAWADSRRVRQIIGNIVSNAVKFTHEGSVEIDTRLDGEDVVVTVKDTGPGIAREQQSAIFEEYRQVEGTATKASGAGLGLAITRRLVRMHQGTIQVDSTLGEGSTFKVTLPIRPRGAQRQFISSAPIAAAASRPAGSVG